MRTSWMVGIFLFLISCMAVAQEALTNASIEKMAKAGLGDDVIISMIQGQPGRYELTPDTLVALKGEGVSEKVLAAMAARNAAPPASAKSADAYEDFEVGVYYKLKDVWTLLPTEPVNWKTGGVLKNFASQGLVKGDINGRLTGPSSPATMRSPMEFLIKAPDGVEGEDFQLVRLHTKSDAREFRTVTGGIIHASGGSKRDAVKFEQAKVGKRAYKITFADAEKLATGEYAFLAAGVTSSSASGSTGKAYTFHFLE